MTEIHRGGCACGAVRYQVRGEPSVVTVCHCTFCQRRLASAFAVLASFAEDAVDVTQGELSACEHLSDVSGRWLKMSFCPRCGTTVSHVSQLRPGMRTVAAGTFDEQDWYAVQRHIWVQSKLPWVVIPDGVAQFEQGFVAAP